ncbi:PspC domain-containing protein [Leucobacter luti]|uniref:Phage shock protein C (PspC) family protein n=1 Tax=Leucobacter luti TaxID=340320 RepID=A0A4Q7TYR5_9MICO|nr:PspC domain-containing protein [Leucobacter luti]MBL3698936.1 PspC domain-containing protein [Leucobacter luti]RZT66314.1 phage shock protein C (PspC) family protein [Leucobacter luti]
MNHSPDTDRPGGTPPGTAFFSWLRDLGIVRGSDRWFAGVAGGIAAKTGLDPLIIRGIFVVLALLGGPGILLYIVGWLLLPDFTGRIHVEDIVRGRAHAGVVTAAIVLAAVVIIPALFSLIIPGAGTPFSIWGWGAWGWIGLPSWLSATIAWLIWIAILVVGGLWLRRVMLKRGRDRAANPGAETPPAGSAPLWEPQPRAHTQGPGGVAPQGAAPPQPEAAPSAAGPGAAPGGPPADDPAAAPGDPFVAQTRAFADRTEEYAQRLSDRAGDWGQRAGDWGQRAGDTATRWSAEVGKQADEWSVRYAERHDTYRLGAGHTIITLALALLAGGLTAVWALGANLDFTVNGAAPAALIAALVAALAVCAVSLIVAGVRGKHTGWIGFLSACGVVALLTTVVLPWGSQLQPFGTMRVTAGTVPGAVLLGGNTEIDLRSLDSAPTERTELTTWQLAGNVSVTLPESAPTIVDVRVLGGAIDQEGTAGTLRAGPLLGHTFTANLSEETGSRFDEEPSRVVVYLLAGRVSVDGVATTTATPPPASGTGRGDDARVSRAQAELDEQIAEIEWQLEKPGLSTRETATLERERDELLAELKTLEVAR